jgi:predicted ribosomally synthesized six-cysteine peptide SCIFF
MHIQTVIKPRLQDSVRTGGCGNCYVSCQSACKTSITVSNQPCERQEKK